MKSIILCVLALAALTAARPSEGQYTDRYDNINLDEILGNKRLLEPYIKCLIDQGRCSPDAKELKLHLKEALENNCQKCTEKQRNGTEKVIRYVINHESEYWNQLANKYDPDMKYVKKYEDKLREVKA